MLWHKQDRPTPPVKKSRSAWPKYEHKPEKTNLSYLSNIVVDSCKEKEKAGHTGCSRCRMIPFPIWVRSKGLREFSRTFKRSARVNKEFTKTGGSGGFWMTEYTSLQTVVAYHLTNLSRSLPEKDCKSSFKWRIGSFRALQIPLTGFSSYINWD